MVSNLTGTVGFASCRSVRSVLASDCSSNEVRARMAGELPAALRRCGVDHRLRGLTRVLPPGVANNPDNLHPGRPGIRPRPNALSNGRLPWKGGACQGLVDDGDPRPLRRVGPVEIAPGTNRNLQRLEVVRRDRVELGLRPLPRSSLRPALNEIVARRSGLPSHPKVGDARRRTDPGHGTQTIEHICIEPASGPEVLRDVVPDRVFRVGHQHTVLREPEIDVLERLERSQQQSCGRPAG